MKVAVIGSGAREHAIVLKLQEAKSVKEIVLAPGNDAMANMCSKVTSRVEGSLSYDGLAKKLKELAVDYAIIGPEKPLVEGLVDILEGVGIPSFGPKKEAAQLEGSKQFAKEFMARYDIPTAKYRAFTDPELAIEYIDEVGAPIVIKADGLAAGKGVVVAMTLTEAYDAVRNILVDKAYDDNRIVIEEFLEGEEVTLLNFSDGTTVLPMISSQDHKRIYDEDKGPNTGGMGAYAPAPVLTAELEAEVLNKIVKPTIAGMKAEGNPFVGCLYAGLIITKEGPKVIEYNVRFGDPETQVVLPLLENDFGLVVKACIEGCLADVNLKWKKGSMACVVMASENYPQCPIKGRKIIGNLEDEVDTIVFHAGTKYDESKKAYITSGGRVLGISAYGDTLKNALVKAYKKVAKIEFEGMQYRSDIGQKAFKWLKDR